LLRVTVPLHVSGIWIPVYGSSPLETGSLGAGLNLTLRLEATGSRGPCSIRLNEAEVLGDQAREICGEYGSVKVDARSPVGLGKGYGVSAALLLSASILAAYHNSVAVTVEEAARLAHKLEVKYGTGLGDITTEYYGGPEIRVKPGPPGIGIIEKILLREKPILIAAALPGETPTSEMLRRISSETYEEGGILLERLRGRPSLMEYFRVAEEFTRLIFDYSLVDDLLSNYKDRIRGYYLKKKALIIWAEENRAGEIMDYLRRMGLKAYLTTISYEGLRLEYTGQSS
jgi:pantoate kinase